MESLKSIPQLEVPSLASSLVSNEYYSRIIIEFLGQIPEGASKMGGGSSSIT
jgi:hypothetical protein